MCYYLWNKRLLNKTSNSSWFAKSLKIPRTHFICGMSNSAKEHIFLYRRNKAHKYMFIVVCVRSPLETLTTLPHKVQSRECRMSSQAIREKCRNEKGSVDYHKRTTHTLRISSSLLNAIHLGSHFILCFVYAVLNLN